MHGRASYSTSGFFWARYREETEANLRLRKSGGEGLPRLCKVPRCGRSAVARRGSGKGNHPHYCIEHTGDIAKRKKQEQDARRRRRGRGREERCSVCGAQVEGSKP